MAQMSVITDIVQVVTSLYPGNVYFSLDTVSYFCYKKPSERTLASCSVGERHGAVA